jgi:hypothetical protein
MGRQRGTGVDRLRNQGVGALFHQCLQVSHGRQFDGIGAEAVDAQDEGARRAWE